MALKMSHLLDGNETTDHATPPLRGRGRWDLTDADVVVTKYSRYPGAVGVCVSQKRGDGTDLCCVVLPNSDGTFTECVVRRDGLRPADEARCEPLFADVALEYNRAVATAMMEAING